MSGDVMIAVDPHKASNTAAVLDPVSKTLIETARFASSEEGYGRLTGFARRWEHRRWAVEGWLTQEPADLRSFCASANKHRFPQSPESADFPRLSTLLAPVETFAHCGHTLSRTWQVQARYMGGCSRGTSPIWFRFRPWQSCSCG
jgi:YHS domain-containing protein